MRRNHYPIILRNNVNYYPSCPSPKHSILVHKWCWDISICANRVEYHITTEYPKCHCRSRYQWLGLSSPSTARNPRFGDSVWRCQVHHDAHQWVEVRERGFLRLVSETRNSFSNIFVDPILHLFRFNHAYLLTVLSPCPWALCLIN